MFTTSEFRRHDSYNDKYENTSEFPGTLDFERHIVWNQSRGFSWTLDCSIPLGYYLSLDWSMTVGDVSDS